MIEDTSPRRRKVAPLTISLTPEEHQMLRQIMELKYPGRSGTASLIVGEAIRRLYEAEVKQR